MGTFADDLERVAAPEPIEWVIIGGFGWSSDAPDTEAFGFDDTRTPISPEYKGRPLRWKTARSLLAYEYDTGFGAADCHAVYAYTRTRVLFVHEYDGATGVYAIPRRPGPCQPRIM